MAQAQTSRVAVVGNPLDTEVPLGLPLGFFVPGVIGGAVLFFGFVLHLHEFTFLRHNYHLLAFVHVFTLVWGSAITIGALHQMAPVVLVAKLHSIRLGWWSLATFVPGSLLISGSFYVYSISGVIIGAILTIAGAGIFAYNMAHTWKKSLEKSLTRTALVPAVVSFLLTLVLGLTLAMMLRFGRFSLDSSQLLGVHLFLGAGGWFTGIIVGVSYRLVPMFVLSHGHTERWGYAVVSLLYAGVAIGTIGSVLGRSPYISLIGTVLILIAALMYAWDLSNLWKKRVRPPDVWLRQVPWAVGYFVFSSIAVMGALVWGYMTENAVSNQVILALAFIFAAGWVGTMILALLHKIIPFLVWYHRYSPLVGKTTVPTMSQLVREDNGKVAFPIYHAVLIGTSTTLALGELELAKGMAAFVVATFGVLAWDLLRLMIGCHRSN